jgi:hypothetical protein
MAIPRDRSPMSTKHIRIAELAREDKTRQFSSIGHLLTVEALYDSIRESAEGCQCGRGSRDLCRIRVGGPEQNPEAP